MDRPTLDAPRPPSPRTVAVLLGLLTAAAFAMRLAGVGFMLPQQYDIHERVWLRQLELIRSGEPEPERDVDFGYYPQLVARLAAALQDAPPAGEPATPAAHAERASADLLLLRRISALISALIVPATWLVARRLLSPGAALLAAGLAGGSVLHLDLSQQARPHAPAAALIALAIAAAIEVARRPTWRSYALAGGAITLGLSVLQSTLAAVPALLAAHVARARGPGDPGMRGLALALLLPLLLLPFSYPFLFAVSAGHDAAELEVAGGELRFFGHALFLERFDGAGFPILARAFADRDPTIAALAAAGLALLAVAAVRSRSRALLRPRPEVAAVLGFAVPYALVAGLYGVVYERFALPLFPVAAVLAASAAARLPARVFAAAAVLLVAFKTAPAAHLAVLRTRPDTLTQAAEWVEANARGPHATVLLGPGIDLPILRTEAGLETLPERDGVPPWQRYLRSVDPLVRERDGFDLHTLLVGDPEGRELALRDADAYVAGLGAHWVLLGMIDDRPILGRLREALARRGRLVARFSPYREGDPDLQPFVSVDEAPQRPEWWYERLLRARRLGPVVEVYALG
ncbi:MAG TPA: glycosyltransferase family 39 protein [Planctomycetota bacterium]|nr:glycosyltransferase family 39 protein [Planctomycetota bacterium]